MNPAFRTFVPLLLAALVGAVEVSEDHRVLLRDIWWLGTMQGSGDTAYTQTLAGDPSKHPNGLGRVDRDSIVWKGKTYPVTGYTPSADRESFKLTFELGTLAMVHGKNRCWAGTWTDASGGSERFRTFGPMWPDVLAGTNRTTKNPK